MAGTWGFADYCRAETTPLDELEDTFVFVKHDLNVLLEERAGMLFPQVLDAPQADLESDLAVCADEISRRHAAMVEEAV